MGRRAAQQATFSKGELDPDLSERVDLEHYYDSLAVATNSLFHPQGGVSDRGGFQLCGDADVLASGVARRLRRRIVPIVITADNITAANGGVAGNLVDQDAATVFQTNAVTTAAFVAVEVDLVVPQRVDFVDLVGFSAETLGADEAIAVQYWDGANWRTFADALDVPAAKHVRTTERTRRFGTTPGGPGGVAIVARQWRIIVLGSDGIGRLSIKGLMFWRETAGLSPVRLREVAREDKTTYRLVLSERNVDVFVGQRYVASIAVPVAAQQVETVTYAGGFDTLLLFHEMIETVRIVRQGSAGEWNVDAAPFVNVPDLASSIVFSGDQDEIQDLDFAALTAGQSFALFLGGALAGVIAFTSLAALPAAIEDKLGTLPGVVANTASASTADTLIAHVVGSRVRVRFSAANGNRAWPLLSAVPIDAGTAAVATTVVQEGLLSTGKAFSAQTGWPRTGAFVQQRLVLAGFRAAPTTGWCSLNPTYWDFTHGGDPLTADKAFKFTLDVGDVEIIYQVFVGRHLQVFTKTFEFWASNESLDATKPVNFIRATKNGIERGVPVAFVEGASMFVQKGGDTLRDFQFVDTEQSYQGDPLTVLAPHLIRDVRDVTNRQARSVRDGNLIIMVNRDGTIAAITFLRKQAVIAGAPWSTDGAFRAVMCDINFELTAVTERAGDYWLEVWTPDWPLDWCTRSTGAPRTVQGGLDYLDGRNDAWIIADGELIGPVSVTGGHVALPAPAADISVGLQPAWNLRSQVLRDKLQNAQPFRSPGRIFEIELFLRDTGSVAVGTNGGAHLEVPTVRLGDNFKGGGPLQTDDGGAPQLPMMQRLYTGSVTAGGLVGIADHPYFEISRLVPAPVHVKAVRYEFSDKGD